MSLFFTYKINIWSSYWKQQNEEEQQNICMKYYIRDLPAIQSENDVESNPDHLKL